MIKVLGLVPGIWGEGVECGGNCLSLRGEVSAETPFAMCKGSDETLRLDWAGIF